MTPEKPCNVGGRGGKKTRQCVASLTQRRLFARMRYARLLFRSIDRRMSTIVVAEGAGRRCQDPTYTRWYNAREAASVLDGRTSLKEQRQLIALQRPLSRLGRLYCPFFRNGSEGSGVRTDSFLFRSSMEQTLQIRRSKPAATKAGRKRFFAALFSVAF